jgi:hypothetical protein
VPDVTSSQRKENSEALLQRNAIAVNPSLPLVEDEDEVELRTPQEVRERIVALWAVVGTAFLRNDFFRQYMTENGIVGWLSARERDYLLSDQRTDQQHVQFSWQLESLFFLGWCAGLVPELGLPTQESSIESFMHLFPQHGEGLQKLEQAIALKSKGEILDWSDLLYRLHWAVRDSYVNNAPPPAIKGGVVQEWHRAVNWVTRYDKEDDWDVVGTDT